MITLISGTNRPNSLTARFTNIYFEKMKSFGVDVQVYELSSLPIEVLNTDIYDKNKKPTNIINIQEKYFEKADKFVFIFPEYNGSIPGILKILIDVLSPQVAFAGKKAGMIGISTGRQGNLRGMDHLTGILQHMDVTVMPLLVPISKAHLEINGEELLNEATLKVIENHIQRMLKF